MAAARALEVVPVMPNIAPDPDSPQGWKMMMPGDEGYVAPDV